ncbi:hypothetical protein BHM03_00060505, partial [Ensete ventricosum]
MLSSPTRRPRPRGILLPREETERLPERGERSRQHSRARTVFDRTPSSPALPREETSPRTRRKIKA